MRVYEELFVLKPDAPEEEVDGYVDQIKLVITSGEGTVDKVDKWGVRKLAYKIGKYNEGIYILIVYTGAPTLVHEIERRMRNTDMVIKFITVRIDEKLKKIEKRKKARDKRAARRPAPQVAAPAAPGPGAAPAAGVEHALPGQPGAPAPTAPHAAPAAPATTPENIASEPIAGGKE